MFKRHSSISGRHQCMHAAPSSTHFMTHCHASLPGSACKNGLIKHVEHLLFYGAVVDAENVNGNTPLHVCAVNNRYYLHLFLLSHLDPSVRCRFSRPECARVLLFRGANHLSVNKQGQTALHVAHIVGTTAVADIIASHNPSTSDVSSPIDFEPTPLSPALQFFEGVDMSGMAMRAGLRPGALRLGAHYVGTGMKEDFVGDYLLEIDGID
ncbi:ankyrin repeat protein, partial [Ancylostoma ceylanicum]